MKLSLETMCDAVTKWSLRAGFFLTPIFFLPLTPHPVDLNKQFVFMSLVLIATIAWLIKSIKQGKIEYVKSVAGVPLAALVIFVILSAFFSGARHISFMGQTGGEADTALAVIGFALLYFLIPLSFKNRADYKNAFIALMAGGSVAVLYALLQSFGIVALPWDFARGDTFNPVGTINAFGLYAGFIAVLSFAIAYYMPVTRRMRLWSGILAGASFAFAFLVGYWALFVALIAAVSVFVVVSARGEDKKASQRNFLPLAAITLSACMLIIATGVISIPVPRIASLAEIAPSVSASVRIAVATARAGVKNFLLGAGPSTYQYEYIMHHDAGLNGTPFWNVQFTQGFNAILTSLVSWGIFGTILFLLFLAAIIRSMFRLVANRRIDYIAGVVVALSAYSVVILFLYPQNFVLQFLLFASAGMLAGLVAEGKGGYGTVSFSLPIGMMFAVVLAAGLLYVNGRRYVAGIAFGRGLTVATETKDVMKALPFLVSGVSLDPQNNEYLQVLASAYLSQANAIAAKSVGVPSPEVQKNVTAGVAAAIAVAERATQVNPVSAANWIALAQVYEAVAPFNPAAASSVLAAYGTAAALDPANPAIPTSIGNVHRASALRSKSGNSGEYAAALASFEKALALKADYAPAYFAIIQMFDAEGRGADALARAERLRALVPDDSATLFQLGLIHYQAGRFVVAQDVLGQAVRVTPNYANALYFLGLADEKLDDHAGALAAFERVAQLNPESAEIKAIIANVRAGKPAIHSDEASAPIADKKAEVAPKKK